MPCSCLYLYGITTGRIDDSFQVSGVGQNRVGLVAVDELIAVVHRCSANPYVSEERDVVETWVKEHNHVLEQVMGKFGAVVPFTFDTIIAPTGDASAVSSLRQWTREQSGELKQKLNRVRDGVEYVVRVLWDRRFFTEQLMQERPELQALRGQAGSESSGKAFFARRKAQRFLRDAIEQAAEARFGEVYQDLKQVCAGITPEKLGTGEGDVIELLKFSCLIKRPKVESFLERLGVIHERPGHSVELTGPFPPYSFV